MNWKKAMNIPRGSNNVKRLTVWIIYGEESCKLEKSRPSESVHIGCPLPRKQIFLSCLPQNPLDCANNCRAGWNELTDRPGVIGLIADHSGGRFVLVTQSSVSGSWQSRTEPATRQSSWRQSGSGGGCYGIYFEPRPGHPEDQEEGAPRYVAQTDGWQTAMRTKSHNSENIELS